MKARFSLGFTSQAELGFGMAAIPALEFTPGRLLLPPPHGAALVEPGLGSQQDQISEESPAMWNSLL